MVSAGFTTAVKKTGVKTFKMPGPIKTVKISNDKVSVRYGQASKKSWGKSGSGIIWSKKSTKNY
jgi:hypothetical protein